MALIEIDGSRVTRYGVMIESNDWPFWISQNGGSVFDDPIAPTAFAMYQPDAIKAVQFLGDMIHVDRSMPSFPEGSQAGGTIRMFLSQQAAMSITNAARPGSYAASDFQWAVAPLPTGPTGIRANRIGGAGFGMNPNAADPDAAWNFLSFVAGAQGQSIFAGPAAAAVPGMTGNAQVQAAFQAPFADVFPTETASGELLSQFPEFVDISNLCIDPALDLVWNGKADAATTIGGIADQVNARLAQ